MTKEDFCEEGLVINLTIDGTEFEDVEVKLSNPNKPLREQIQSIVKVFNLPETDSCGTPIQYLLGQMLEDSEEPVILEFEDEDGSEQSITDYGVKPGESLHLLVVPAYACPVPSEMEKEWLQYYLHNN